MDFLSDQVRLSGLWADCRFSQMFWNNWTMRHPALEAPRRGKKSPHRHIEIGANIGLCLVPLLQYKKGLIDQVIAFEPSPSNLYHLTSTITRFVPEAAYKDSREGENRFTLFPNALGSPESRGSYAHLMESVGNSGRTIVRHEARKGDRMRVKRGPFWRNLANSSLVTLDDAVLSTFGPDDKGVIQLVKIDAEGSELEILRGAHNLLASKRILNIIFEVKSILLPEASNGTVRDLFDLLRLKYRYTL